MSNNDRNISRRGLLRGRANSSVRVEAETHRRREFFVRKADEAREGQAAGAPAAAADEPSRRDFVRTVAVVAATAAVARSPELAAAAATVRLDVIAAIGDVLIPSEPGDPGYKDLERFKITEEVVKALPGVEEADAALWNDTPKVKFGKTFLEMGGDERGQYVQQVLDGTAAADPKVLERLRRVFRNTRRRIVTLYYANFPEHEWPRDADGMPILKPGDTHQITNPNTTTLITGWDQSGFHGPLTWEEEERRRNLMKALHWHEGWSPFDYQPEPPALRQAKVQP